MSRTFVLSGLNLVNFVLEYRLRADLAQKA